jgi:hypothetical protein
MAGTSSYRSIAARTAVLGLIVLALATQSHATTIILTLGGSIGDYHYYTYTDADNVQHSEYTGPYPATLSGGSYGSGVGVFVMCYDLNVHAYLGASYDGVFEEPTEANEIEAAYLQMKLADLGGYSAPVSVSGPYSMAVWQLMDSNSVDPAPFPLDPLAAGLVAEAQNAYTTGAWTQQDAGIYPFWEPVPITTTQRFGFVLGRAPEQTDVAPEPVSAVLMAAGFGVLLALRRKR